MNGPVHLYGNRLKSRERVPDEVEIRSFFYPKLEKCGGEDDNSRVHGCDPGEFRGIGLQYKVLS